MDILAIDEANSYTDAALKQAFALTPLSSALESGLGSTGVGIIGDSTGNETTEWVHLCAVAAAAKYPAFEVRHRVWDNVAQRFPAPLIVSASNDPRHLPFTAVAFQTLTWTAPAIVGDLVVEAEILPTSWTGSEQVIAGQFPTAAANQRAWYFYITTTGDLAFNWTTDGTTLQTAATSGAWTKPAGKVFVKVELDVDNGSSQHTVRFYTSTDGDTYTQIGTTVTRSGVTSIFNSTAPYEIGGRADTAGLFNGKMYEVRVRSGLVDGPYSCPALPEHWAPKAASPGAAGKPILTFVNGSHPGANFAYLADAARMPKLTPNYGQCLVVLSSSHNEASYHGNALLNDIKALAAAVSIRVPNTPFAICTQNPRMAPANRITEQAQRRQEYTTFARAQNWTLIDSYRAFTADSRGLAALVNSDGFHPNPEGSKLWAGVAQVALGLA